jgi:glycosyltransferase involved in cell wall biosynthesis
LPELRAQDGPAIILKVVHVPFVFAPDPVGGTEIYVEALAHGLRAHGIESLIAAPGNDQAYEHNDLRVRRFRSAPESKYMLRELYGDGDPQAAAAFAKILDEECPDAVHVHAFTRAVSVMLVRVAKQRGLPVVFTYHTATVSCQRGTLMLWGKEACDGVVEFRRCTNCLLESRRVPRLAAALMSYVPRQFARALDTANLSGGLWTALRMADLMRARQEAFHALMREVDSVVAPAEWVRALLVRNGVPGSKITLSPAGLPGVMRMRESPIDVAKTPLRVAFLGRADALKGLDTLVKAVRSAPGLSIELDLYGVVQSPAEKAYWAMLKSRAADDARITLRPPVPHDQVVALLSSYHLLALPSRSLEPGPLVILESFAAGTPVIGSKLGGIAEWVRHQDNGLLLEAEDVRAWADAFRLCAEDRRLLARLRQGVQPPRSMADVADEMAQLYHSRFLFERRKR